VYRFIILKSRCFKKQARNLLDALQRRDAVAVNRYYSIDSLADVSSPRLVDAQYIQKLLAEQFNLPQVNESVAPGPGFDDESAPSPCAIVDPESRVIDLE
jgi:hypothetical protein